MKYLIASDIHGSAYYLKALTEFYRKSGADKLILLGDLLYHGARNALPREYDTIACTQIYNSLKEEILCVRGNCDSEVDQMVLEFPITADYATLDTGTHTLHLTHGHKIPAFLTEKSLLLNGHFHVPAFEQRENYFYINCGSVAIPKENSPHSCLTVDGDTLRWYDLETGKVFRTEKLPVSSSEKN